jgi:hypothetical protein
VICRVDYLDRVVLVGHDPLVVFATTSSHIEHLQKKADGHYDREDLMALVDAGNAVLYDEKVVRDVMEACPFIVFGCPPAP